MAAKRKRVIPLNKRAAQLLALSWLDFNAATRDLSDYELLETALHLEYAGKGRPHFKRRLMQRMGRVLVDSLIKDFGG